MSDIEVTVSNAPIQVTACVVSPIAVSVGTLGVQGATGPSGANGADGSGGSGIAVTNYVSGISASNSPGFTGFISLSGLGNITVSTGTNNSIYFSGDNTLVPNDAGLNILSGNLESTGSNLQSQINNLSNVGIDNIVYQTGDQNISGAKTFDQSLFISNGSSGGLTSAIKFVNEGQQHYTIGLSGASLIFANTSDNGNSIWGDNPIVIFKIDEFNNVYTIDGQILSIVDSGNLTDIINNTGNVLNSKINSLSGYSEDSFYLITNPQGFLNSLSGLSTGYIQNISGVLSLRLGETGSYLLNQINNISISNVVYTTGNQLISGIKNFNDGIVTNIISGIISNAGVIDFDNKRLVNGDGTEKINWDNGGLFDASHTTSVNWEERKLIDNVGVQSINYQDRTLKDNGLNIVLNWNDKVLIRSDNITTVDWQSALLYDVLHTESIDWGNRILLDSNGSSSINYNLRFFIDSGSIQSINWNDRLLKSIDESNTIDWNNKIISGDWILLGNLDKLTLTGANLYNLISNLSGYNNTNPSGYITNVQTGQFYPYSNPLNFSHSGNVELTGQTLYRYISDTSGNLSNRLNNTGSYLLGLISASSAGVGSINSASGALIIDGTGGIIVITNGQQILISGDTGAYANFATNTNLFNTGSDLNFKIDLLSGYSNSVFATITNLENTGSDLQNQINNLYTKDNPSGFLNTLSGLSTGYVLGVSGDLINKITDTGATLDNKINVLSGFTTGLLIELGITGSVLYNLISNATGYINTNPSGFITNLQTGQFYPKSNPSGYITGFNSGQYALTSNLQTTGQNLYQYITNLSGNSQFFTTEIVVTGLDQYVISYPVLFPTIPKIQFNIEVNSNNLYIANLSGRNTGNYTILFSEVIGESGVFVHTYASI